MGLFPPGTSPHMDLEKDTMRGGIHTFYRQDEVRMRMMGSYWGAGSSALLLETSEREAAGEGSGAAEVEGRGSLAGGLSTLVKNLEMLVWKDCFLFSSHISL